MTTRVSRILHAGYQIEVEGAKVLFDPIVENPFSYNCHPFPEVNFKHDQIVTGHWDAIFISHIHDDHFSLESLKHFNRNIPIYIFSKNDEARTLLLDLGFKNVCLLELQTTVSVAKKMEITAFPALDVDMDSIYHIRANNLNILNVVDSWIDDNVFSLLEALGPWDLVMWPFQSMREMDCLNPQTSTPVDSNIPHEHLAQILKLSPKRIIASSCQFSFEKDSWLNNFYFPISYASFKNELISSNYIGEVINLLPSDTITLESGTLTSNTLNWVELLGLRESDYEYLPNQVVPDLQEFSENRFILKSDETKRLQYWLEDLDRKFSAVSEYYGETQDFGYNWTLNIYNDGKIFNTKSLATNTENKIVRWKTEILAAKLLSAIESGESLSSLYIRINDVADTERLDPLQDPLLKLLYSSDELKYQKAQLKKIKGH